MLFAVASSREAASGCGPRRLILDRALRKTGETTTRRGEFAAIELERLLVLDHACARASTPLARQPTSAAALAWKPDSRGGFLAALAQQLRRCSADGSRHFRLASFSDLASSAVHASTRSPGDPGEPPVPLTIAT
jgi:hypothetical protein